MKGQELPWLSGLPKHWNTRPFRYLGQFQGGGTPSKDEDAYWGGEIPWVSPKDMKSDIISDSQDHITEAAVIGSSTRMLPADSLMLVVRSGILQHSIPVAINTVDVALNQDMKGLVPAHDVVARYYRHFIAGWQSRLLLAWRKPGATVESLDSVRMLQSDLPLPPADEQQAIADFLDRKTAAIDALIAKKERLIELLQEKRQALITQAVTKGLDPTVPMKDSGIEWLGQIPKHWSLWSVRNLVRMRHLSLQDGNHGELHPVAADYVDDGIPFVMANNLGGGRVDLRACARLTEYRARQLRIGYAQLGDVLLSHKGTMGQVAIIDDMESQPFFMLTPQVTYYRPHTSVVTAPYLASWFEGAPFQRHLRLLAGVGSTRAYLGVRAQRQQWIVLPPTPEEQAEICGFLTSQLARIERARNAALRQVALLHEYRQALITEAVTGKLDIPVVEAA